MARKRTGIVSAGTTLRTIGEGRQATANPRAWRCPAFVALSERGAIVRTRAQRLLVCCSRFEMPALSLIAQKPSTLRCGTRDILQRGEKALRLSRLADIARASVQPYARGFGGTISGRDNGTSHADALLARVVRIHHRDAPNPASWGEVASLRRADLDWLLDWGIGQYCRLVHHRAAFSGGLGLRLQCWDNPARHRPLCPAGPCRSGCGSAAALARDSRATDAGAVI